MSDSAFVFLCVLVFAAFGFIAIEWGWRRTHPPEDSEAKKRHIQLMKEIRKHDDRDKT